MDAEFLQPTDQGFCFSCGLYRPRVCFIFVFSGEDVEEDRKQGGDWGVKKTEKYQPRIDGDMRHTEGVKELLVAEKEGEDKEHHATLKNGCRHHFEDMFMLEMAHLVGQHRQDFVVIQFLHQCIKKDDSAKATKTGEKSVKPRGAFRAIHCVDALDSKVLHLCIIGDDFF